MRHDVADVFAEMYEAEIGVTGSSTRSQSCRDGASEQVDLGTPTAAAAMIKHAAPAGAISSESPLRPPLDLHRRRFSVEASGAKPNDLPDGLDHVIVIGQRGCHPDRNFSLGAVGGRNWNGLQPGPVVLLTIAQYLRALAYQAVPSMNDTALASLLDSGRLGRIRKAWPCHHAQCTSVIWKSSPTLLSLMTGRSHLG